MANQWRCFSSTQYKRAAWASHLLDRTHPSTPSHWNRSDYCSEQQPSDYSNQPAVFRLILSAEPFGSAVRYRSVYDIGNTKIVLFLIIQILRFKFGLLDLKLMKIKFYQFYRISVWCKLLKNHQYKLKLIIQVQNRRQIFFLTRKVVAKSPACKRDNYG
jgi:hypothetical protein